MAGKLIISTGTDRCIYTLKTEGQSDSCEKEVAPTKYVFDYYKRTTVFAGKNNLQKPISRAQLRNTFRILSSSSMYYN